LLEKEDEIISWSVLIINDFISRMDLYPWLCALFVEEKYKGNVYSLLLIEKAMKDTRNVGFEYLFLRTNPIGFYEKYGFEYIAQG
jgi:N-acetylglutamate synthase-like GNAT family acetyltransferase